MEIRSGHLVNVIDPLADRTIMSRVSLTDKRLKGADFPEGVPLKLDPGQTVAATLANGQIVEIQGVKS